MSPREIANALASVVFSTIINNTSRVKIPNFSGPRFLRRIGDTGNGGKRVLFLLDGEMVIGSSVWFTGVA